MNPSSDLVNKLWRLCAVLRKDGITYQQYVTELTYLLFLKMMAEQKREEGKIPKGARWGDLIAEEGIKRLALYRELCGIFGDGMNQAADFFSNATSIPSRNVAPLTTFGN